jgi:hypothetical protein
MHGNSQYFSHAYDDEETFKLKSELIESVFSGSRILKRGVDKVMMYYNMPKFIISHLFTPSRLFPSKDGGDKERYPEMSKVINYFESSPRDIPSLILIDIETNEKKRITLGCFSQKSWNSKLVFNRNKGHNSTTNLKTEGDLDDFDPMKMLGERDLGDQTHDLNTSDK